LKWQKPEKYTVFSPLLSLSEVSLAVRELQPFLERANCYSQKIELLLSVEGL
jgi:hypothetical protein